MEAVARLKNYPTSPRKMRLLADLIRGMEVDKALEVLQYSPKHPAIPLYKLLKSAINNWEQANGDSRVEDAELIVKSIMVDGGRVLKRMKPAAQGRGYRIRKRSNHVTLVIDSAFAQAESETAVAEENEAVPAEKEETKATVTAEKEQKEEVKDTAAKAEVKEEKKAEPKKAKAKKEAPKKEKEATAEVKKEDQTEDNKEMDQSSKNKSK